MRLLVVDWKSSVDGSHRANGYYSPFIYFTAKILFDILPLRVVPPFILGAIIYKPVGLVPAVAQFWNLILVLILFNLVASSAVFLISIVVTDGGVANLTGSLVMLFKFVVSAFLPSPALTYAQPTVCRAPHQSREGTAERKLADRYFLLPRRVRGSARQRSQVRPVMLSSA